jgi:hypothetical protein
MSTTNKSPHRVSRAAMTGLKDFPTNAAWVLARTLRPATQVQRRWGRS